MNKTFCYIHIPFCESKCKYCRFASVGSLQDLQIQNYVNYLSKEISTSQLFIENKKISSIYFGGGTPSVLSKKQFGSIFKSLQGKYTFSKNIEISIESTPQNINKDNIKVWLDLGINRISIGIQSLNNKTLEEIGRKNNKEIFSALDCLDIFFTNLYTRVGKSSYLTNGIDISIDFIIGLPYVEKGGVREDIKTLLERYKFINHISVYMLEDYYEIPTEKESKFQSITYPDNWDKLGIDEKDYLREYLEIKKYLEKKGFVRYELSNFSKSGKECKHNIAYWSHSNILAFGLGASGLITSHLDPIPTGERENQYIRYSNSDIFKDYYSEKSIFKEELSKEDIFLEKIMFNLRTSGLEKEFYNKLNTKKIDALVKNNLLYFDLDILKVSNNGIILLDYIIGEILN